MDDAVDAEDPVVVDLPPQYNTISNTPAARRGVQRALEQQTPPPMPQQQPQSHLVSPDLLHSLQEGGTIESDSSSFARGRPLLDRLAGPEEDESEFWRSS